MKVLCLLVTWYTVTLTSSRPCSINQYCSVQSAAVCLSASNIYSASFFFYLINEGLYFSRIVKCVRFFSVRYHKLRWGYYTVSESQAPQLLTHWVVLSPLLVHFSGEVAVEAHLMILVEDSFFAVAAFITAIFCL